MAIITVNNNGNSGSGSLREAIKTAQSGDTIKFDSSLSNRTINLERQIAINKSLTIDGGNAEGLTISGGEQTRLFSLSRENQNLSLKNLTLADAYYTEGVGSALWASENSTVSIDNINFINNVSQGAALHGQKGTNMTVTNSTFDNNDGATISNKAYSAGAISLFSHGNLTVSDSVFTNNTGLVGGALRTVMSGLTVENSVFIGNDSTSGADKTNEGFGIPASTVVPGAGGAIYVDGASVPDDPRFYQGSLEKETTGDVFKVVNSRFENNRAAGEGGAIMAYGYNQDTIIIQDSEIINNEVIENASGLAQGGGMRLSGFVEIDNTVVADNRAEKLGGGLYLQGEVPAVITNSDFTGNQAVDGGAIYDGLWDSTIKIDNTNFDSNLATNEGGVFESKNDQPVSFQNSSFSNNSPDVLNDMTFNNDLSDIVYGSNGHDNIVGKNVDSYLVGLNGHDTLRGHEGNDYLDGGMNDDSLFGGIGKDTLIGGGSENYLVGGNGDDVFVGGNGQDLIRGGGGSDLYIIGDENQIYYNERPWYDHAIIEDFQPAQDTIQLFGEASDYSTRSHTNQGVSGTGIFYNNGLVALVGDMSPNQFDLNAQYISYGDATNNVEPTEDDKLKLTSDPVFSGEPNYNPGNHSGLIVWNDDDTWHLEATGDIDGERLTGRIIVDSPIEDLSTNSIENSDRVEFVDNSNEILEFDLRVWNQWTDGLSFKVADDASVFLDLDNSSDVSVKAGADLQEVNLSNV